MVRDPEQLAHLEWLGYVQPVGLVVSIPALLNAQAHVSRNISAEHQQFLACLPRDKQDEVIPELRDFPAFTQAVLGWEPGDLIGAAGNQLPGELEVAIPGYNETLRPTYAVREFQPNGASRPWLMLIKLVPPGQGLDALSSDGDSYWQATPQAKFERLLRETQVSIGLLANGMHVRLVYAPRGETSGYVTFSVADMAKVAGRPIFAALHMLLNSERLFSLPERQRLPAILADSRKYQNVVSTKLAEQVLAALYELLRGFQSADEQRRGELLREVLAEDPNHVYAGLLTVLLRMVFVLFAEDRGLVSSDPVYTNYYSLTGLFQRLRSDAGRYPDTMDQRYGAWAQLLTLFRLIYDGGRHGGLRIPPRRGYLFDPDRYNFLEGRSWKQRRQESDQVDVPRISDGVIHRVLEKLLILDGERLSYRTLDVEQIGSVYETMMGFNLEVAKGRSIAIKPTKAHGAPTAINVDELLAAKPGDRVKWLAEKSDQKVAGKIADGVKSATSTEELLAALDRKIAHHATPNVVPKGAMLLQPSDERRRSGSHYTPRSLTEPIVRTTLKPILEQLGEKPTPDQILALKVCDPAMGSGAFLVEACRQLGDSLVEAWHVHNSVPPLPADEDEVLHARRLVAQRCLYGVDKNPMAVDLSKLSLWLATLAKDHPFTFLDHSLKAGDSLVGLSRQQIADLDWNEQKDVDWMLENLAQRLKTATAYRTRILAARDDVPYEQLKQELAVADEALGLLRLAGDTVIAAFFAGASDKERRRILGENQASLIEWLSRQDFKEREKLEQRIVAIRNGERPVEPFHWEIEFPEVFTVDVKGKLVGGFDAIVGNPPFLGGTMISTAMGDSYKNWLYATFTDSGNRMDLVAYFYRRAFLMLRYAGTFGLIGTNSVAQGDTRKGGLSVILSLGGTIYSARRRIRWPGQAAVIVSVVHVFRGVYHGSMDLDGAQTPIITAFLFRQGSSDDPLPLRTNKGCSFEGMKPYGQGFVFDDDDPKANPMSEMERLLSSDDRYRDVIFPYISGEEVNDSPQHMARRYILNFGQRDLPECQRWPLALKIVEEKVRPERESKSAEVSERPWWQFFRPRTELATAVKSLDKMLVLSRIGQQLAFALLSTRTLPSEALVVFPIDHFSAFAVMQSRVHEFWARSFASSMKDDMRYTPSDCFETFPFPSGVLRVEVGEPLKEESRRVNTLEAAGRKYYEFRAALMVRNNEGLTKTYNRFHNPHESTADIAKLRELHAAMDRTVLDAYGWTDLEPTCGFALDYLDIEDEDEIPTEARERIESGDLFFPNAASAAAFDAAVSTGRRRLPWRYRWPDEFRDEVLARLLALNAKRAEEERLVGAAAETATRGKKPATPKRRKASAKKTDKTDRDQHVFYVLMLLRAWGKPITRHALEAGLVLMLNDELRSSLLGTRQASGKLPKSRVVEGLNLLIQEMTLLGEIASDESGAQQILRVLPSAPDTDAAPPEDQARLSEVMRVFEQERNRGKVVENKDYVDGEPGFVSP